VITSGTEWETLLRVNPQPKIISIRPPESAQAVGSRRRCRIGAWYERFGSAPSQVHDTVKQGLITYAVQVAREKGASAYMARDSIAGRRRMFSICPSLQACAGEARIGQQYNASLKGVSMREIAEVIGGA